MESYRAWVLCFDASGEAAWAAVVDRRGVLQSRKARRIGGGRERSKILLALIAVVLAEQRQPPSMVATCVGPATPGGIRHNVVLANALARAWGVPVASLSIVNPQRIELGKRQWAGTLRPVYNHPPHITLSARKK